MGSPSQSSSRPSRKRPHCEPSTSRERVASSSSDLFDSQSEDLNEWQQSSMAWKKSYDQKVAQCLARNQLPIGPVEKYLNLISPILAAEQRQDSTQQISSPAVPALPHSTTSGMENTRDHFQIDSVDLNQSSSSASPQNLPRTHSGRILLAPETPGVSLVLNKPSILLAPETPASPSNIPQMKKAPLHARSPGLGTSSRISDEPQTKQLTCHNTELLDNRLPARESRITVGRLPSRSEALASPGLHHTTSETSAASVIKAKNVKHSRRASKVKEIDTLEAYDKLSAKERSARFPRVQIWADFLARSNMISSKRKKTKGFMNRCRIYYLIDPAVQQNLDDADRMRMRRLYEAGAQIQSDLRANQVTHIIVRNDTSWNSCLRAIKSVVPDPSERQTIKDMCMASLDKTPGEELIWIMDFKWVSSCLSYSAIPVEKYTCIRPRASKIQEPPKPMKALPITSPESQDYNRSTESEERNNSSYDEIETSISLK